VAPPDVVIALVVRAGGVPAVPPHFASRSGGLFAPCDGAGRRGLVGCRAVVPRGSGGSISVVAVADNLACRSSGCLASFATMSQTTLLPSPPTAAAPRRSSKGIGPGDIVEVDKKGRRFHALVVELDQVDSGRFHLSVRPLDSRISYRQATVREVIAVWRRAGR
jgi:hypothetical protein